MENPIAMDGNETENKNVFDYICVLDFEATCDDIERYEHEIIEFPCVLLKWNGTNYVRVSSFQQFCKPLVKPVVTDFCHNLTGITQEQVNGGGNFPQILKDHHKWLMNETNENFTILTCGFWDLGIVMISECKKWGIEPNYKYRNFINIKNEFKKFYGKIKGYGMAGMLRELGMELEGRHHSGIDDCHNISRILQRMVMVFVVMVVMKMAFELVDGLFLRMEKFNQCITTVIMLK